MKNIIRTRIYESPCGSLLLGSYGDMLCLCDWLAEKHHGSVRRRLERLLRAGFVEEVSPVTEEAARQLDEYFAGRRRAFDLPLLFAGTEFQKAVWGELLKIPFGFRPLPPCGRQRPFPDRLRRGNRGQAPDFYIDVAMRRFFTQTVLFGGGLVRKVYPARRKADRDEFVYTSGNGLTLRTPKGFIRDIYYSSVYSPDMRGPLY